MAQEASKATIENHDNGQNQYSHHNVDRIGKVSGSWIQAGNPAYSYWHQGKTDNGNNGAGYYWWEEPQQLTEIVGNDEADQTGDNGGAINRL